MSETVERQGARGGVASRGGAPALDRLLYVLATAGAWCVALMLLAVVLLLCRAAWPSISLLSGRIFVEARWTTPGEQGASVLNGVAATAGTLVTALLALVLAAIPSLATAIFLTRIASRRLSRVLSFVVECLAAVPSLAFGLWGILVLVPALERWVTQPLARDSATARSVAGAFSVHSGRWYGFGAASLLEVGLVLALMIAPMMAAACRDVLTRVPRGEIEATIALGATWWSSVVEMLWTSRAALAGSALLGLARATGETMAVVMVLGPPAVKSGAAPTAGQTIASLIAQRLAASTTPIGRASLVELACVLLVIGIVLTIAGRRVIAAPAPYRGRRDWMASA